MGARCLDVGEFLDTVISEISNIDEASAIHANATRPSQSVVITVDVEHPTTFTVKHLYDAATFLSPCCQVTSTVVHTHSTVRTTCCRTATDVTDVTTIQREHLHTTVHIIVQP